MAVSSLENWENWAPFIEIRRSGVGLGEAELSFLCGTGIAKQRGLARS